MKKAQLIDLVYEGKLDSVLDDLYNAILQRRSFLRDKKALTNKRKMLTGSKVEVVGNIRPKYLLGYRGTVVAKPLGSRNSNFPTVYVDFGMRIRRYGPVIGMPANTLELVED